MSRLLILANEMEGTEEFEEHFEEINRESLANVMIDIQSGGDPQILVSGEPIEEWDAIYIEPRPKAFNYLRVLTEIIASKRIRCNLDPSSVFILAKKPYLFKVLSDREISIPRQVSISTEKGMTDLEKNVDFPVVAKKYSDLKLSEVKKFEEFEQLKSFAELSEHGKDFLVIQELDPEAEIFDILYIDGEIISLKIEGVPYDDEGEVSSTYHGVSDEQKEIIENAVNSIGTKICRLRLSGNKITDIDVDPQMQMFKQKSGKNVYGRVADYLKGDEE